MFIPIRYDAVTWGPCLPAASPRTTSDNVFSKHTKSFRFVVDEVNVTIDAPPDTRLQAAVALAIDHAHYFQQSTSFSCSPAIIAHVVDIIRDCSREFTTENIVAQAKEFFKDAVISEDRLDVDTVDFVAAGCSLEVLASQRMAERSGDRFNLSRLVNEFGDTPEFSRLQMIAAGAPMVLDANYKPQPYSHFRKLHQSLGNTMIGHSVASHDLQRVLLLRESAIPSEVLREWNMIPCHFVGDKGKLSGRFILDCSNSESLVWSPLNTEEVLEEARHIYGDMELPQIMVIIQAIYDRCLRDGRLVNEYSVWMIDIKSAFPQFNMLPADVKHLCFRVAVNVIAVMLVGFFGLCFTPLIWDVFSRTLLFEINRIIVGFLLIYVDDLFGLSPR